jgi:hypothetical protein
MTIKIHLSCPEANVPIKLKGVEKSNQHGGDNQFLE